MLRVEQRHYSQFRTIFPLLIKVYMPGIILLFCIGSLKLFSEIDLGKITRDPIQIMRGEPYFGLLSNIGILIWCSAMTICVFSSVIARKNPKNQSLLSFFYISALVTGFLMLDDLFLFHEVVFPKFLHINQKLIYVAYLIIVAGYLIKFYRIILSTDYLILILAFVLFGCSISIDILAEYIWIPELFFSEDSFKFLGIISWATYYTRTCFQVVNG